MKAPKYYNFYDDIENENTVTITESSDPLELRKFDIWRFWALQFDRIHKNSSSTVFLSGAAFVYHSPFFRRTNLLRI